MSKAVIIVFLLISRAQALWEKMGDISSSEFHQRPYRGVQYHHPSMSVTPRSFSEIFSGSEPTQVSLVLVRRGQKEMTDELERVSRIPMHRVFDKVQHDSPITKKFVVDPETSSLKVVDIGQVFTESVDSTERNPVPSTTQNSKSQNLGRIKHFVPKQLEGVTATVSPRSSIIRQGSSPEWSFVTPLPSMKPDRIMERSYSYPEPPPENQLSYDRPRKNQVDHGYSYEEPSPDVQRINYDQGNRLRQSYLGSAQRSEPLIPQSQGHGRQAMSYQVFTMGNSKQLRPTPPSPQYRGQFQDQNGRPEVVFQSDEDLIPETYRPLGAQSFPPSPARPVTASSSYQRFQSGSTMPSAPQFIVHTSPISFAGPTPQPESFQNGASSPLNGRPSLSYLSPTTPNPFLKHSTQSTRNISPHSSLNDVASGRKRRPTANPHRPSLLPIETMFQAKTHSTASPNFDRRPNHLPNHNHQAAYIGPEDSTRNTDSEDISFSTFAETSQSSSNLPQHNSNFYEGPISIAVPESSSTPTISVTAPSPSSSSSSPSSSSSLPSYFNKEANPTINPPNDQQFSFEQDGSTIFVASSSSEGTTIQTNFQTHEDDNATTTTIEVTTSFDPDLNQRDSYGIPQGNVITGIQTVANQIPSGTTDPISSTPKVMPSSTINTINVNPPIFTNNSPEKSSGKHDFRSSTSSTTEFLLPSRGPTSNQGEDYGIPQGDVITVRNVNAPASRVKNPFIVKRPRTTTDVITAETTTPLLSLINGPSETTSPRSSFELEPARQKETDVLQTHDHWRTAALGSSSDQKTGTESGAQLEGETIGVTGGVEQSINLNINVIVNGDDGNNDTSDVRTVLERVPLAQPKAIQDPSKTDKSFETPKSRTNLGQVRIFETTTITNSVIEPIAGKSFDKSNESVVFSSPSHPVQGSKDVSVMTMPSTIISTTGNSLPSFNINIDNGKITTVTNNAPEEGEDLSTYSSSISNIVSSPDVENPDVPFTFHSPAVSPSVRYASPGSSFESPSLSPSTVGQFTTPSSSFESSSLSPASSSTEAQFTSPSSDFGSSPPVSSTSVFTTAPSNEVALVSTSPAVSPSVRYAAPGSSFEPSSFSSSAVGQFTTPSPIASSTKNPFVSSSPAFGSSPPVSSPSVYTTLSPTEVPFVFHSPAVSPSVRYASPDSSFEPVQKITTPSPSSSSSEDPYASPSPAFGSSPTVPSPSVSTTLPSPTFEPTSISSSAATFTSAFLPEYHNSVPTKSIPSSVPEPTSPSFSIGTTYAAPSNVGAFSDAPTVHVDSSTTSSDPSFSVGTTYSAPSNFRDTIGSAPSTNVRNSTTSTDSSLSFERTLSTPSNVGNTNDPTTTDSNFSAGKIHSIASSTGATSSTTSSITSSTASSDPSSSSSVSSVQNFDPSISSGQTVGLNPITTTYLTTSNAVSSPTIAPVAVPSSTTAPSSAASLPISPTVPSDGPIQVIATTYRATVIPDQVSTSVEGPFSNGDIPRYGLENRARSPLPTQTSFTKRPRRKRPRTLFTKRPSIKFVDLIEEQISTLATTYGSTTSTTASTFNPTFSTIGYSSSSSTPKTPIATAAAIAERDLAKDLLMLRAINELYTLLEQRDEQRTNAVVSQTGHNAPPQTASRVKPSYPKARTPRPRPQSQPPEVPAVSTTTPTTYSSTTSSTTVQSYPEEEFKDIDYDPYQYDPADILYLYSYDDKLTNNNNPGANHDIGSNVDGYGSPQGEPIGASYEPVKTPITTKRPTSTSQSNYNLKSRKRLPTNRGRPSHNNPTSSNSVELHPSQGYNVHPIPNESYETPKAPAINSGHTSAHEVEPHAPIQGHSIGTDDSYGPPRASVISFGHKNKPPTSYSTEAHGVHHDSAPHLSDSYGPPYHSPPSFKAHQPVRVVDPPISYLPPKPLYESPISEAYGNPDFPNYPQSPSIYNELPHIQPDHNAHVNEQPPRRPPFTNYGGLDNADYDFYDYGSDHKVISPSVDQHYDEPAPFYRKPHEYYPKFQPQPKPVPYYEVNKDLIPDLEIVAKPLGWDVRDFRGWKHVFRERSDKVRGKETDRDPIRDRKSVRKPQRSRVNNKHKKNQSASNFDAENNSEEEDVPIPQLENPFEHFEPQFTGLQKRQPKIEEDFERNVFNTQTLDSTPNRREGGSVIDMDDPPIESSTEYSDKRRDSAPSDLGIRYDNWVAKFELEEDQTFANEHLHSTSTASSSSEPQGRSTPSLVPR